MKNRAFYVQGPVAKVACVWDAAASIAGAYAPKYIASALAEHPDEGLVTAVRSGLFKATCDVAPEDVQPRGCDISFDCGGEESIIWRTSVCTELTTPRYWNGEWVAICWLSAHPERLAAAKAEAAKHGLQVQENGW